VAFAGEHRVGGGTGAFVRQMHEINADHHLEQFRRQMQIGAAAARCVIELARLILRKDDEFREQLARQAIDVRTLAPGEFGGFLKAELAKWGKVVRAVGIKPE